MPAVPMTYTQIADDLDARIIRGEYTTGDQLPTYAELADIYSVSVATVQRALVILKTRGSVAGVQGKGVFVRPVTR